MRAMIAATCVAMLAAIVTAVVTGHYAVATPFAFIIGALLAADQELTQKTPTPQPTNPRAAALAASIDQLERECRIGPYRDGQP